MKNGTKKKWNPSPIIFFSFSTSISLYLPLTTSAALSWTSRHILLPPDCSDALTHSLSLSHGVNRAGSLSRLPIEESSAHKHTQACVFIPSQGDYICASLPRVCCIFVLMLSPLSEHIHTHTSVKVPWLNTALQQRFLHKICRLCKEKSNLTDNITMLHEK